MDVDAPRETYENGIDDPRFAKFDFDSTTPYAGKPLDPTLHRKLMASIGASGALGGAEDGEEGEGKGAFARDPVDNAGRRPGEEGYNPKECRIPGDVYAKMTAAKKQYWDYKRSHFDEVVFFQQGDFFNLFANDADIGVQKFGLSYNRLLDSVGFNRKQLKDWATKFANMGYKVTVLEQDSTATTEEDKAKKSAVTTKKKGTEDRSVTNRITAGTVSDFEMFDEASARYLLVIAEEELEPLKDRSIYGISFIDTSTYEWGVTHFVDDPKCSQLETLLLRLKPKEILYQRMGMSRRTKRAIEINIGTPTLSFLAKYPDYSRTQVLLSEYFDVDRVAPEIPPNDAGNEPSVPPLPFAISQLINSALDIVNANAMVYRTAHSSLESQLALTSVGAAILYFKELTRTQTALNPEDPRVLSAVDAEMVQRARYHLYSVHSDPNQATMVLDAIALANLSILENDDGGTDRGTLLSILDYCATSYGRRRLRQWVCHPLRRADDVLLRQSMVRWFFERPSTLEQCRAIISKTKDMERLITRAEATSITLPLFLDLLDSLEILMDFIGVLKTFIKDSKTYSPIDRYCEVAVKLADKAEGDSLLPIGRSDSDHLEDNLVPQPLYDLIHNLPELQPVLSFYGFDRISARKENMITPVPGTNEAFDTAQTNIETLKTQLDERLAHYKKELKDSSLSYHFSKTENYSVVVSRSSTSIPADWVSTKAKAGNRYRPPDVALLSAELEEAESDLQRASAGALMSCLESFVEKGFALKCAFAIFTVSQLDVLMSLARYSCNAASESEVCLPEPFTPANADISVSPILLSHTHAHLRRAPRPFLEVSTMKHPFVSPASGGRFIPNSVDLGSSSDSPAILLVTGPNMGGKSTLLRQVCILTIMAQLGCYVPAESCRFTPVDRIFTRIGARDNLIAGQSTFMVELEETAKILAHSTSDSLIILDELGRGTSTFDGYALAFSVLKYFSEQSARVLFSTHYHKLTQEFTSGDDNHKVQQGHMACQEENGNMTFLYQLALGPCPNSFGLEVAAMAHIPHSVLTRASIMSDMFEVLVDRKKSIKAGLQTETGANDFLVPGSSALTRFSFARLLKLLPSLSISDSNGSGAKQHSTQANTNNQLQFFKAEVSRLWRQVRFIDAQAKQAIEESM